MIVFAPASVRRLGRAAILRGLATAAVAILVLLMGSGVARADPVSITTSTYGSPEITTDSDGTLITVDSPPAGLYYNISSLDPTHSYRVIVDGSNVGSGPFVLRLMQDQDTPTWQLAPNGVGVYRVSDASSFELLFYRATSSYAEGYQVHSIQVQDCGSSCGSDANIEAEILQDSSGLASALAAGNTYLAAELIQEWAAPRTPAANVASDLPPDSDLPASELYYDYFQTDRGGVFCGGAAQFLHELLGLFSIPSFVLNFGDPSFFTHAVVVLPLPTANGTTDYRLLDPTFDATYTVGPYGTPVSIPQMLELWRAGLTDLIDPSLGPLGDRTVISQPYADGQYQTQTCAQDASWQTMCSFSTFTSAWAPSFETNGYETGLAGLLQMLGTLPLLDATPDTPNDFVQMQSKFSAAVAAGDDSVHVAALPLPPTLADAPKALDPPVAGRPLTISAGNWTSPAAPVDQLSYEWELCNADASACSPLPGATGSTYTPATNTQGDRLRVTVTASNPYGDSQPTQVLTGPVAPADTKTSTRPPPSTHRRVALPKPNVKGTPRIGRHLLCVVPATTGLHSFIWLRDGHTIHGSHAARYRVTRADSGDFLKCALIPHDRAHRGPLSRAVLVTLSHGRATR